MKDFPFFNTEHGAASLTLREIPYTKTAYIKILDSLEPQKLLDECMDFCKLAGAECIYGSNHPIMDKYPFHTRILQMTRMREGLPDTDAALFPVTEQTLDTWRGIYNKRMLGVPNASYMSDADGKLHIKNGDGYFIHKGEILLGVGISAGDRIDAVISLQPGAGEEIILALNHALSGDQIVLEVASTNEKAVRLYERMGFIKTCELSSWVKLL